jgi:hypothetical protein
VGFEIWEHGISAFQGLLDGGRVETWRDGDTSDEAFEHIARGMRSTKARAFKGKVDEYEYASISTG